MNVLYLTINPNRASTTVPTEGWFMHMRPRGLRPVLVSHEPGAFHAWALEHGIAAFHVPLPFPSKSHPWTFLRSLWGLRSLVRRHGIRIIHCNEQNTYPIGQYLGRLCGLPVVVSIHSRMGAAFYRWAFKGSRRPKRIFFISRGSMEIFREGIEDLIPEGDWRLLYNAIDLTRFRPDPALGERFRHDQRLGIRPLIGVACALRPGKQLEHLFEAAAQLNVPELRVLLAGGPVPGEEDYAERLLRAGRRILGDSLVHLGYIDDLRGLLNALDLFVNTSKEETCSISVLEALACGCPVVGYPSVSVSEQILPGGGEIVGQDRIGDLAGALANWLGNAERREAGRLGARSRAEVCFDIRDAADQLWDEYLELSKTDLL